VYFGFYTEAYFPVFLTRKSQPITIVKHAISVLDLESPITTVRAIAGALAGVSLAPVRIGFIVHPASRR
jgi:hypothetical protein